MILIALGANLPGAFGTPRATLAAARRAMEAFGLRIVRESSTWLTAPVPVSDQPWYHNEVVAIETDLAPLALLERLQKIEFDFGRIRTERNAPRIIDLDIIAYDDVVMDEPGLIVPHPRMHERAFVLLPLREVAPRWRHPLLDQSLNDLIAQLPQDQQARPMPIAGMLP